MVSDDGASHTQSVERLIQKITKVSDIVFTPERREQYVRAQERASELRGEGKTKADFGKLSNFNCNLPTIYTYSWDASHRRLGPRRSTLAPPISHLQGSGGVINTKYEVALTMLLSFGIALQLCICY